MNSNVQKIQISGIRRFFNKVVNYPNAISLTLGEPDFKVPQRIKDKMIDAINSDKNSYTPNMGIYELRKGICEYLEEMDIAYSPEEVCISVGGSEGIFAVLSSILNFGDKIVIPNPSYPAYASVATLLGANIIDCKLNDDFSIDIESLKKIIKEEKPKLLILSYPSNPTGAILTKQQKEELVELIKENDLLVLSDEIYCSIYFGEEYYSVAQSSEIREKLIIVGGFSKMFSMTGLRIGYVCAVKEIMDQVVKVHQYAVSCAPSISQWGAYEGLISCRDHLKSVNESFKTRRDYVYDRLMEMGLESPKPMGAFYIFPSIKKLNIESETFCDALLKQADVAIVPGIAFGTNGEGHVRISYSYSEDKLQEGLNRLEKWINK